MMEDSDSRSEFDPMDQDEASFDFNSGIIRKTEYFDLFISYKRDNGGDHGQKLAEELYEKLTKDGFKIWLDNEEIGFSSDFELRLEQAILHSKKIACVIGPAWVNSPNCRYEVKKAVEFEKRIIPIHYQEFRTLLKQKKNEGELTDYEWRKLDKPQEVDFSAKSKYRGSYNDLKALCELDDFFHEEHTKLLCESYYWDKHGRPKSMLLSGVDFKKAKLFKRKSDADSNYSSFANIQNEFLAESKLSSLEAVSNKRQVYVAYTPDKYAFAKELNLELKLHDVTTWFEDIMEESKEEQNSFLEDIINSDSVIDVLSEDHEGEIDVKVAFARSNSKRVIQIADTAELLNKEQEQGKKGIVLWNESLSIDDLITSINGDEAYIKEHTRLFSTAFNWEQTGKNKKKLLPYGEAIEFRNWYKAAETQGNEPPPNAKMIDFVERSISYAQGVRRKKRLTFWTTTVGIVFLAVFGTLTFVFLNKKKIAEDLEKQAYEAAEIAKTEKADAERDAQLAEDQAILVTQQAEAKEKEANAKVAEAEIKLRVAEANVETAQIRLMDATSSLSQAMADASDAERDAAASRLKVAQAQQILDETNEQLVIAQKESDSISMVTRAKIEAIRALEFLQLSQRDSARISAELAVSILTDSIDASANVQSLYTVYKSLIPSKSILSMVSRQKEKDWTELESDLEVFYPDKLPVKAKRDSIKFFGDNYVSIAHNTTVSEAELIKDSLANQLLANPELKNVSAVCLSPSKQWVALGFRNGVVEIRDAKNLQNIERLFNHSYRITSIAFSPNENQIATSSIDERFSLVALNENGSRDVKSEIIIENNIIRPLEIFYWNEEVLITKSWNNISKAWATDVLNWRKELNEVEDE